MHTRPLPRVDVVRRSHLICVIAVFAASAVLLLTECAAPAPAPSAHAGVPPLSAHGLEGLDARQVIDRLDAMPIADRPDDLIASVRPDALVMTDGRDGETTLRMPEREFYLSVAPYSGATHECYFHSLTTCVGELANTDVRVTVTNTATGSVVIDDMVTSYDNGFVGLWLPRDIDATLTMAANGRTGTQAISTGADDPTCLTTLQLS